MDSSRARPVAPPTAHPADAAGEADDLQGLDAGVASGALTPQAATRLGRVIPIVRRGEWVARRVAAVSAVAGVFVATAMLWAPLRDGQIWLPLAVVIALALVAPAVLTWLGAATLREVTELPGRLRAGAATAAGLAKTAARTAAKAPEPDATGKRPSRLFAFVRALWEARSAVLDLQEGGARALMVVRLVRLSSLPFLLATVVAFLLNFAVIALAFVTAFILVVF